MHNSRTTSDDRLGYWMSLHWVCSGQVSVHVTAIAVPSCNSLRILEDSNSQWSMHKRHEKLHGLANSKSNNAWHFGNATASQHIFLHFWPCAQLEGYIRWQTYVSSLGLLGSSFCKLYSHCGSVLHLTPHPCRPPIMNSWQITRETTLSGKLRRQQHMWHVRNTNPSNISFYTSDNVHNSKATSDDKLGYKMYLRRVCSGQVSITAIAISCCDWLLILPGIGPRNMHKQHEIKALNGKLGEHQHSNNKWQTRKIIATPGNTNPSQHLCLHFRPCAQLMNYTRWQT